MADTGKSQFLCEPSGPAFTLDLNAGLPGSAKPPKRPHVSPFIEPEQNDPKSGRSEAQNLIQTAKTQPMDSPPIPPEDIDDKGDTGV